MADILLTHAYFLYEDEKERHIMKPYPPLGLLYLAGYLRREGYSVDLYDSTLGSSEELRDRIAAGHGAVLGIYTNLITRVNALGIIAEARTHGWTVIVGGPEPGNYPGEYLNHGADVVVVGEGEVTLSELLAALSTHGRHRLHDVAGIWFRDETGQLIKTLDRPQIQDIDALPKPARDMVDIREYMRIWKTHHGRSSVNLITARGCPYRCRWCSHAVFGYTHRRRSYMDCADELEEIWTEYRPDQVWYADDVFTMNHSWLRSYNEELKRRNLHLPFETISRADRMMKDDVVATLAELGCYRIWIGSESGSQRILDAMQRGVTAEQVQWAAHAARRHGIEVGMFLMWGYEGETLDDIEATIEHVKGTDPDIFFTTVAYPIKNTAYFHEVSDRILATRPWEQGSDRDAVIMGRHSRNYYRHADRWLRSEVEAHRLKTLNPVKAHLYEAEAVSAREALLAAEHEVEG